MLSANGFMGSEDTASFDSLLRGQNLLLWERDMSPLPPRSPSLFNRTILGHVFSRWFSYFRCLQTKACILIVWTQFAVLVVVVVVAVQVAFPFFVSFLLLFLIVILPLLLGIVLDAYAQQHAQQRTLHRNKVRRLSIQYHSVRSAHEFWLSLERMVGSAHKRPISASS